MALGAASQASAQGIGMEDYNHSVTQITTSMRPEAQAQPPELASVTQVTTSNIGLAAKVQQEAAMVSVSQTTPIPPKSQTGAKKESVKDTDGIDDEIGDDYSDNYEDDDFD